jgi:hypothetical protein
MTRAGRRCLSAGTTGRGRRLRVEPGQPGQARREMVHLGRAYGKLDIKGRPQLAAALAGD